MSGSHHHDAAVIVGAGPGGGSMDWCPAQTGKRIPLLERRDCLRRGSENWDTRSVSVDATYQAKETWFSGKDKRFHPGLHHFVGGNSKGYGSILFRLRERDFEDVVHPDGIAPAWPIKHDVFEPYHQKAEEPFHVRGLRGEDPTESWSIKPYAQPPVSHEPRIQQLFDGLTGLGHRPFHPPVGILLDETDGVPRFPQMPFDMIARHSIDFWLTAENRIYYRDDKVHLDLIETNMEGLKRLKHRLKSPCGQFDIHPQLFKPSLYLGQDTPTGGTAHQDGTLRFGTDPRGSVLDTDCKAHQPDSLYVTDASFFPWIGAVSPTLTIVAELRVGPGAGLIVERKRFRP